MSLAAVLLALALLLVPARAGARLATGREPARGPTPPAGDPLAAASALDTFACCLAAGMPTAAAAGAAARSAAPPLAGVLARAADLLALGASSQTAWTDQTSTDPHTVALLRLARRSAKSGAALAGGVGELAAQVRTAAAAAADARAQRASVLIAGPLGLCYLPAFVCLGIVPVIAGLAGDVLGSL